MRKRQEPATNAQALESTITTLRGASRLRPEDDALVAACRSLAVQLDGDVAPRDAAPLWNQYRQLIELLVKVGDGGADDDTTAWVLAIQTPGVPAKVRNAKKS